MLSHNFASKGQLEPGDRVQRRRLIQVDTTEVVIGDVLCPVVVELEPVQVPVDSAHQSALDASLESRRRAQKKADTEGPVNQHEMSSKYSAVVLSGKHVRVLEVAVPSSSGDRPPVVSEMNEAVDEVESLVPFLIDRYTATDVSGPPDRLAA